MIAEAVDLGSGTIAVGVVATLLVVAAGGGAAYARIVTRLDGIGDVLKAIGKRLDKHEESAQDHRHDDAAKFQDAEIRLSRLEVHAELTPIGREPTGPRDRLRGNTPRPSRRSDTGDTDSGMRER